jgi:hypothetical protein
MFFATESKLLKFYVICIIMLFNNTLIENMLDSRSADCGNDKFIYLKDKIYRRTGTVND